MKVILGVDAIRYPLTGIGRYALELARGLRDNPRISDCRYFSMGRFVPAPITAPPPARAASVLSRLVQWRPAAAVHRTLTPALYGWRLRGTDDCLFHSPSFLLPPVGGPAVATVHDLSTFRYPQFHPAARVARLDKGLPQTLARATHLITDSEFTRQEVIDTFGWRADKVSAVPLGVSMQFAPRQPHHTRAVLPSLGLVHGSYILCVSTLEPRKNIGTLLDAYLALPEMLRRRFPLVIAGAPGWHSDALHERLRGAAARGVRYVQYVPEPNLPALYAGAAVFALASLYEGYGLPVLEAMASGVPVLASNASSLPEVTGPDALLLPPLDIDAWRYGIERALEDHAWRQRCIAGGILRARQATWERCVAGTLDVYQKAWAH